LIRILKHLNSSCCIFRGVSRDNHPDPYSGAPGECIVLFQGPRWTPMNYGHAFEHLVMK
jgi:hypothetical protein